MLINLLNMKLKIKYNQTDTILFDKKIKDTLKTNRNANDDNGHTRVFRK